MPVTIFLFVLRALLNNITSEVRKSSSYLSFVNNRLHRISWISRDFQSFC